SRTRPPSSASRTDVDQGHQPAGHGRERAPQGRRLPYLEREGQTRQLPREPVEAVDLTAEDDAGPRPFEHARGAEELALGGLEVRLEQHLGREGPGYGRERERDVGEDVEPLGTAEPRAHEAHGLHAVEAEGAKPAPQVAPAHDVPVPGPVREAVGVEVALRLLPRPRAVGKAGAGPPPRGP